MIISRSPLRISIGGGGTDLPSYYQKYGGFVVAGAIDKYVYVTTHETFQDHFVIKYSQVEQPQLVQAIRHPIIREALQLCKHDGKYLEITSMADIPAGTGLGSSGSFATALLKAIHHYQKEATTPRFIAERACHIEIDLLGESVGKQDQFIAAYGGITCFEFAPDGTVESHALNLNQDTLYNLEDNLSMFFTGYSRSASTILETQNVETKQDQKSMIDNLHRVKELGHRIKDALESGDPLVFGQLMHEHWEFKKKRSSVMTNQRINELYDLARQSGAVGGKLVGAGGGGFLLFYTENKQALRKTMAAAGLKELRFRFEFEGTKILV